MRKLVRKKLRRAIQNVQEVWNLFKNTVLEAQKRYVPQIKNVTKWTNKPPAWFNSRVIQGKKAFFKKFKLCPSRENGKAHELCQGKCKSDIRQAKQEFEEQC